MGLVGELVALIRRPLSAPIDDAPRQRGRPPLATSPVSETDLADALARCAAERTIAEQAIATRATRREAMLLEDDSDTRILALGSEIDTANLRLERLDALEPQLHQRLAELRELQRLERWAELRDAYVQAGRQHLAALERFATETGDPTAHRAAVAAEFPDAPLPLFPQIAQSMVQQFGVDLERCSRTMFDTNRRPVPLLQSMAEMLRKEGPDAAIAQFGPLVPAGAREIGVRFLEELRSSDDSQTLIHSGIVRYRPPDEAEDLIRSGKAEMIGAR